MSGSSGDSKAQAKRNLAMRLMQLAEQTGEEKDWPLRAKCAENGYDSEDWFPEQGAPRIGRVRAVCMSCPVRQSCLAHAIGRGRDCYGVWGGYTHDERRKYLTWRRRQATGSRLRGSDQ